MARFIDSNILVRYFTEDDPVRARTAESIIDSDELIVSGIILSEVAYVLRRRYGYPRAEIVAALLLFLGRDNVQVIDMPKELVAVSLLKAQRNAKLSFGDALILAQMQASGYRAIYSFDTRFRDEDITVLDKPAGRS